VLGFGAYLSNQYINFIDKQELDMLFRFTSVAALIVGIPATLSNLQISSERRKDEVEKRIADLSNNEKQRIIENEFSQIGQIKEVNLNGIKYHLGNLNSSYRYSFFKLSFPEHPSRKEYVSNYVKSIQENMEFQLPSNEIEEDYIMLMTKLFRAYENHLTQISNLFEYLFNLIKYIKNNNSLNETDKISLVQSLLSMYFKPLIKLVYSDIHNYKNIFMIEKVPTSIGTAYQVHKYQDKIFEYLPNAESIESLLKDQSGVLHDIIVTSKWYNEPNSSKLKTA